MYVTYCILIPRMVRIPRMPSNTKFNFDKQKYIDKRLVRDFYCNHGEDYINGIVSFPDILNNGEVL